MKVSIKKSVSFDGQQFAPGVYDVADSLSFKPGFQELVKSGAVEVLPRDEAAVAAQKSKDFRAAQKAVSAKEDAQAVVEARAGAQNAKSFAGPKPALSDVSEAKAQLVPAQADAAPAAESADAAQAIKPASPAKSKAPKKQESGES